MMKTMPIFALLLHILRPGILQLKFIHPKKVLQIQGRYLKFIMPLKPFLALWQGALSC